jgi:dTMP kinase
MKQFLLMSHVLFFSVAIAHEYSGRLCAIEGIDGAGKTTLLEKLKKKFEETDLNVIFTREPGATELGHKIRSLLISDLGFKSSVAEYLLFAADRARHFAQKIIPALQAGTIVISDRMADSSLAYQGYVKGVNREMIQKINAWCMQGIEPDLVIYLRITPEQAKHRISTTRAEQTKFEQEYFDRMQMLFDAFEQIFAQRKNALIIDGMQDVDVIAQQVFNAINCLN